MKLMMMIQQTNLLFKLKVDLKSLLVKLIGKRDERLTLVIYWCKGSL